MKPACRRQAGHPAVTKNGSALILVVVVTALLSVIGVIFVMTMRMREMTTSNITDNRDLDAAVHSTVGQIGTILVQDLFGTNLNKNIIDGTDGNEPYDSLGTTDRWLASLEPRSDLPAVKNLAVNTDSDPTNDWYQWERITDLSGGAVASKWDLILRDGQKTPWDITKKEFGGIVEDYQEFDAIFKQTPEYIRQHSDMVAGLPADADGDGVADSRWVMVPNLTTSKAKPVFAAVRIVDNCAMLNLNVANCFQENTYTIGTQTYRGWFYYNNLSGTYYLYNDSTIIPMYYRDGGKYLSEINYLPFLRGSGSSVDNPYGILATKKLAYVNSSTGALISQSDVPTFHQVLMSIENPRNIPTPGTTYNLFDIGDELEMRNRFLLTSLAVARFEGLNCAYNTFDYLRGEFIGGWNVDLRVKRIPIDNPTDLSIWKERLNPLNFDTTSGGIPIYANYYDRRHVCTFYSFDRNIRTAQTPFYTFLDSQSEAIRDVFVPKNKMAITTNITVASGTSYNYNNVETRRKILHLLYAFREYFENERGLTQNKAAIQAAQIVASMIDYGDDNNATTQGPFYNSVFMAADGSTQLNYGNQRNPNPTFITRAIVRDMIREVCIDYNKKNPTNPIPVIDIGQTAPNPLSPYEFGLGITDASETVYGYECQPFISEIYTRVDDSGVVDRFAIELYNPYSQDINVENWKLTLEGQTGNLLQEYSFSTGVKVVGGGRLVVRSSTLIPATGTIIESNIFGTSIKSAYKIRLIAKDPVTGTVGLVVDQLRRDDNDPNKDQILLMTTDVEDNLLTHHSLKRVNTLWKFCNANAFVHQSQNLASGVDPVIPDLGSLNIGVSSSVSSYSLPVANDGLPIERLADFEKIAFIGNQKTGTDPNTITDLVGKASAGSRGEADVRFDITSDGGLLNYICTLNRSQGNLPGRININTASKYVIAAAIPPQLVMTSLTDPNNALYIAEQIVANRPYTNLGDLLKIQAMRKYLGDTDNSRNLGDQGINDDLEERDWILSRLSNIFTVRSDTFTAYILVRLGTDGPQRRMLAIFDRSNVWSSADKPKLVALHPVPDPR